MLHSLRSFLSIVRNIVIVVAVFFTIINLFLYFMDGEKPKKPAVSAIEKNRNEIYATLNELKKDTSQKGKVLYYSYHLTVCKIIGEGCTDNPADGDVKFNESMLGKMSGLISTPYANPPASGAYWVYSGLQQAGFIPNTYAAEGIGFAAIKPLAKVWSVMRDLAYMLLVLVMVSIGFMVMFRMKLNPQTVISVESALPKIILSLIYITFSFAIAGFLIDMMYIMIVIGISVLAKADPSLLASPSGSAAAAGMQLQNQYLTAGFGTIWDSMFPVNGYFSQVPLIGGMTTLYHIGDAIVGLMPGWINGSIKVIAGVIWLKTLLNWAKSLTLDEAPKLLNNVAIFGNSLGSVGSFLSPIIFILLTVILLPVTLFFGAGFLVGIVVVFTMLLLLFRIFFLLLTGYLKILLLIVFAPIFMLFEAIPGKHAFNYWFKSLMGELIVFPAVIFILVFGRVIVNLSTTQETPLWQPPFLYGINANSFSMLLGMGLIFMIPEVIKLVKEMLGFKGMPIGLQLGTFFGGAAAGVGGATGLAGQFYTINHGLSALTGMDMAHSGGLLGMAKGLFGENAAKAAKAATPPSPGVTPP